MFDIEFYRFENGKTPVEEFLDSLNSKMRNKAVRSLELLEEFGNTLRAPNSKAMGDGLFEILLVRAPENLGEIHECIQALQSQKYNCAMLTFRSAQKVRIFADPEMPWTLDGEKEDGHETVEVENLHHAIRLMQKKDEDA